jgi:hypothetical protein
MVAKRKNICPCGYRTPSKLTDSIDSRSPLEEPIVTQLVKKFPAFYETLSFITTFIRTRHWSHPEPGESNTQLPTPLPSDPF